MPKSFRWQGMTRIETLREQAHVMRTLARSFDSPALRGELMALARRCEELAAEAAREIAERQSQPIGRTPSS
jgi:hypothetical protein